MFYLSSCKPYNSSYDLLFQQTNQITFLPDNVLTFVVSNICHSKNFKLSVTLEHAHTAEHTYARLTFVVRLVDNAFLSKYC